MSSKVVSVLIKNDKINVMNLMKESGIKSKIELINEILSVFDGYLNRKCEVRDYKLLIRLLSYLEKVLSYQTPINKQLIMSKLDEIKENYIIKTRKIDDRVSSQFKSAAQFISNIESLMFIYQNSIILPDLKEEVGYELLDYLVFESKNYYMFEKALISFPYLVNLLDQDGKTLLENVILKYLNYIRNADDIDNSEIVYYNAIIDIILCNSKFKIDDNKIDEFINDIENMLKLNDSKKDYYIGVKDKVKQFKSKKTNHKNTLKLLKIHDDFPKIILESALKLTRERPKLSSRILIHDYVITIDDDFSRELDDGLSIRRLENGNFLLGVHIANVLSIVPYDSPIIKEASIRTTSIYCDNYHIPMLPSDISIKMLSLKEGVNRPSNSYFFEIDCDGNIVNTKFLKSMVRVNKRYNYKEVNDLMEHGSEDKFLDNMFQNYYFLLQILNKRFTGDEVYMTKKKSTSNLSNTNLLGSTVAEKLVELTMLTANNEIFKYFDSNNLPCLYRSHTLDENVKNEIRKLLVMKTDARKIIDALNGFYPKAFYSYKNHGHYGMGLSAYGHATSPLRRFPDILTERCLDTFYYSKPTDEEAYDLEEEIKKCAKYINRKQLSIEQYINAKNKELKK